MQKTQLRKSMSQLAQDMTQCLLYVSWRISTRAIPGVWELVAFLLHRFSCCLAQTRLRNLVAGAASDPGTDSLQRSRQNSVKHSILIHDKQHILYPNIQNMHVL